METNQPFNTNPNPNPNFNQNFNQNSGSPEDGKTAAIVSYFGIVLWLVAYFALHKDKKTDFGSYQLRQTLLFAIVSTVIYIVFSIFIGVVIMATGVYALGYLGWIIYVGLFVMWIIGFLGAINGEKKPIPLIGEKAQTLFPSI